MKVLNVLFDDRFGGPQKRVFEVAKRLKTRGISTKVCLPANNNGIEAKAKKYDIELIRLDLAKMPKLNKPYTVFPWCFLLLKDIFIFIKCFKKEKPDLVHVNGAFFIAPSIAARLLGVKLVWHLNDTIVPRKIASILGGIVRLMANEVVVAAEAVAVHYRVTSQHTVLYAPVDTSKFFPVSAVRSITDKPVIGIVANCNPIKGLEYFVNAIYLIHQKMPNIQVVMAGAVLDSHKKYNEMINKLIDELSLNTVIQRQGYLDDAPAFMHGLDVFMLTSISEACPIVVLEAMASGIPVVATDVGGVKELLRPDEDNSAGIVVKNKDVQGLADAVLNIICNTDEYSQFVNNGIHLVSEFFSLNKCVEIHHDTYMCALDR